MESKVKNENHVVIHGWMINELNLKGNELLIYAIIYGFSQNENQKYIGSLQYLADWTNSTKQGVMKNIKSLILKQLIVKENKVINGVNYVSYYTTKFHGVLNKVSWGGKQSLPNNIEDNIEYNINNKGGEKNNLDLFDYDWVNENT
jgi:DNA-binding MarR family transcriptional regulator